MKSRVLYAVALGLGALACIFFVLQHRDVHAARQILQVTGTYPESPATMAAMQAAANKDTIRAHAWAILAAFTNAGASNTPDWEGGAGWQGKCSVGLGNSQCNQPVCSASPPSNTQPLLLEKPPQAMKSAHSRPFDISSVLYNAVAAQQICNPSHPLNSPATWSQLKAGTLDPATTLTFGPGAVIVKEIWERVTPCASTAGTTGPCPPTLFVWDKSKDVPSNAPADAAYPDVSAWTNSALPVNTNTHTPCDRTKIYPYYEIESLHPTPISPDDWIPISCFHYRQVNPGADATFPPGSGRTVGTPGAPPINSYIVLVGFHVITAELQDWTWNTFWWTKPDVDTGERDDHPDAIKNNLPWSLYSMDATLDARTPLESDGGPKIVFNPYLEGPQANGPVSNCIACHSHAVYRQQTAPYVETDSANLLKPRCLLINPANTNCTTETFVSDTDFFNKPSKAIPTHFLWSLAAKQDPAASRDFANFRLYLR